MTAADLIDRASRARNLALLTIKLAAIICLPGGVLVAIAWWAQRRREREARRQ